MRADEQVSVAHQRPNFAGAIAAMAGFLASDTATHHMAASSKWQAGSGISRTQALRNVLASAQEAGRARMSTADLASASGVPTSQVSGLLKADIQTGRVLRHYVVAGGRSVEFELSACFDQALQQRLGAARALLVRHGYAVLGPG